MQNNYRILFPKTQTIFIGVMVNGNVCALILRAGDKRDWKAVLLSTRLNVFNIRARKSSNDTDFRVSICLRKVFPQG